MKSRYVLVLALALGHLDASADEGLWTLESFPLDRLEREQGIQLKPDARERIRAATIEFDNCSGAFVSQRGLVMTHADCAKNCLRRHAALKRSQAVFGELCRDAALRRALPLFSTLYCDPLDAAEHRDATAAGFVARSLSEEVSCPNAELRQVTSITDVTGRVKKVLEGVAGGEAAAALRRVERKLQQECGAGQDIECQLTSLYGGARFELHTYRVYRDIRAVFVPENAVASFGNNGDRFQYPTYAFPVSFVRVYDNGHPLTSPFFPFAESGPREGEFTLLAGSPSPTSRRELAVSLEADKEIAAWFLPILTEARGLLLELSKRNEGAHHQLSAVLQEVSSDIRNARARLETMSAKLLQRRRGEDEALRIKVFMDPRLKAQYGPTWDASESLVGLSIVKFKDFFILEDATFGSLVSMARGLVRAADERRKPNEERLAPYTDQRLGSTEGYLLRPLNWDAEFEKQIFAFFLRITREVLGSQNPTVKKLLGSEEPDAVASRMVSQTRLFDARFRKALWTGGKPAIEASTDPFITLMRKLDRDGRAARRTYEVEVVGPSLQASRAINQARFDVYGSSLYPDGTSTLRLRHGHVKSYSVGDSTVAAMTALSGVFGLATMRAPYELPERWLAAKPELDLATPFTFCADTDGVFLRNDVSDLGGPFLNQDLEVVGLAIGGNEAAAGAVYAYEPGAVRSVGLNSAAMLHVLQQVYHADKLTQELLPAPP